ncbi:MAG: hypothetical protein ACREQD_12280, partial [Candidatus Binataceae bacterium]
LRAEANGNDAFAANGKFGRIGVQPPVLVIGERAPGLKCQRCWCYYDDGGHPDLCPRCRGVVAAESA